MEKVYGEVDVTWSSIENRYKYSKTVWIMRSNGIPVYTLLDEDGNRIKIC